MKKAVIALALLLLLGPFMGLLGIGVLMNPAANAECTIDGEFNRSMQHRLLRATVSARRRPRRGCASRGFCGAGC